MSQAEAEFDEDVVQRILAKCMRDGPPRSWRDLPPDVLPRVTEADVREASRRVKATSRNIAEASAREASDG